MYRELSEDVDRDRAADDNETPDFLPEPGPDDGDEDRPAPVGPLERRPAARHAAPAALLFLLFYIASVLYADYPAGDYLWAGGEKVYGEGEYWRLLSSLFVHGDLLHLLSNAFMFMVFGWLLRAYYGFRVFPVLTLGLGTAVNAAALALYEPRLRLIGASGMIYSMAALWLVLYVRFDKGRPPAFRILRAAGFVLVMLVPSTLDPSVSYLSHALGFIAGMGAGLVLKPCISVRDPS